MNDLIFQLRKCKDCSCSRCYLNGTDGCYVELAITELKHYEQAIDVVSKYFKKYEEDYE